MTLFASLAPVAAQVQPKPAKQQKSAPRLSDTELERRIRAKFAASRISVENFRVRVENGTAILEGRTAVIQRKGTATRLARLAGAAAVKNQIEITEEARAKAAGNLAQGRRRAQVTRSETRDTGRQQP
jgi:osmotically-inducible protein OsmY